MGITRPPHLVLLIVAALLTAVYVGAPSAIPVEPIRVLAPVIAVGAVIFGMVTHRPAHRNPVGTSRGGETLREPVSLAGYDLTVLTRLPVAAPGMTTSSLLRDADTRCTRRSALARARSSSSIRPGATTHLQDRSELSAALENRLARTILQMTSSLGVTSVAEGVERPEQITALQRFGCDTGQGFLLSRPLEVDSIRERFGVDLVATS